MFPAADSDAIDLLRRMLRFNPNKRCTADEALNHNFFKSLNRKEIQVRDKNTIDKSSSFL